MMYKVLIHMVIDARDDRHAAEDAKKLADLLKHPMVKMAIEGDGIRLAGGDGKPVVYAPKREYV